MAEKPRLKDTDEILSSIGKAAPARSSAIFPTNAAQDQPSSEGIESLIDSVVSDGPKPQARGKAPSRRSQKQPVEEPEIDRNPLDFGKYQLPKRETPPAAPAAVVPEEEPPKKSPGRKKQPAKTQETPEDTPAKTKPRKAAAQPQDQGGEKPSATRRKKAEAEDLAKATAPQAIAVESGPVITEYQFEELGFDAPTIQPQQQQAHEPPVFEPVAQEEPVLEATIEPPMPEIPPAPSRESHRENFLRRLSSQFEQEFNQRFEDEPVVNKTVKDVSWFDIGNKSGKVDAPVDPPLPPEEELEADAETDAFLQQFEEQVRQEEQKRAESFKDTLAEKFDRERERYLRELGINPESPPGKTLEYEPPERDMDLPDFGFEPPARRRLDLQIQPEMHSNEAVEPLRPVTYGRNAATRPLEDLPEDLPYIPQEEAPGPFVAPAATVAAGGTGKKTSEQLLLELAAHNALRSHQTPQPQGAPRVKQQKTLKFRFTDEESSKPQPEKSPGLFGMSHRKTIAITTVSALVVLALIVGPVVATWLRVREKYAPPVSAQDTEVAISQDTLTVYESRNCSPREVHSDVLVRRPNISIQNMSVDNHLVIGEIESQGEVTLRDVSVGGTIYVKNCGVNSLVLSDVQASRVIVNNQNQRVAVEVTGNSRIGTVEMKTPGDIRQTNLVQDAMGIENVLVQGVEEFGAVDVKIQNTKLNSLVTIGDSLVALSDGSTINSLTSEGGLSLTGTGSVMSMASAAKAGSERAQLRIRDISVANLLLKHAAALDTNTHIDSMAVSDGVSVSGGGVIGTMTLSPQFDSKRLPIDLQDTNVSAIISNAQSRVNLTGGSRVATLTCNDSVYALGNKVNHLVVNANNVIYEREPDSITVATGIRPPGTVADNPNLDYNLTTSGNSRPLDLSGDDVATTCNHPRESGGFVKGDGSKENPFEISSAAQLAHINGHLGSHFIQTGNVDIAADSAFASGFPMIASGGSPFTGTYDGNGYAISGLRISSAGESVGLFAENTGTVRNVHVTSGDVRSTSTQRAFAGGVVGLNYDGGLVEACANGATVSAESSSYAGGVVGYNYGAKIRNTYNYAKISGTANVGGITGVNRDSATISNSYNVGTISASMDSGSIVGLNSSATLTNCYYLSGTAAAGIGSGEGNVIEKTSDEMSASQMASDLGGGEDSPWTASTSNQYTYPVLRTSGSFGASSSAGASTSSRFDDGFSQSSSREQATRQDSDEPREVSGL